MKGLQTIDSLKFMKKSVQKLTPKYCLQPISGMANVLVSV